MKKIVANIIVFVGLFSVTGSVLAVDIPNPLNAKDFSELLTKYIIPGVAGVVGSLATIMVIVAGILYLTSAGNPQRIETAKKALIYAIVGIAIAVAATAIADIIKQTIGVQ